MAEPDNSINDGAPNGAPSHTPMYHTDPEVTSALARIEEAVTTLVKRDDDKEARLRSLERWRWGLAGGIGAIAAMLKGIPAWMK